MRKQLKLVLIATIVTGVAAFASLIVLIINLAFGNVNYGLVASVVTSFACVALVVGINIPYIINENKKDKARKQSVANTSISK